MILLISVIAGIISGFGIGGGAVLIPALILFAGIGQHMAQSVNLFYFIPTAISALWIHFKNKNISIKDAVWLIATGIPSAILASFFATNINEKMLKNLFGCFLFAIGIYECFRKEKTPPSA